LRKPEASSGTSTEVFKPPAWADKAAGCDGAAQGVWAVAKPGTHQHAANMHVKINENIHVNRALNCTVSARQDRAIRWSHP
jgi:hypothetical protein